MTTFSGSKTRATPIFSSWRKATGPVTSFAMTTSQRTMTASPGAMSSASASVCGSELLQVVDRLLERDDVAVLGVDVVEAGLVRLGIAVADGLARDERAV